MRPARAVLLALLALAMLRGTAEPQELTQDSVIRLPLRVHLLRSAQSEALTTTWTEVDVHALLATANVVWRQAGIEWALESIVREEASNGAVFDSILAHELPRLPVWQQSVLPRDALLADGWNLFLIRDYGHIAGGVFWPEVPCIVLAQRGMGFDLEPTGRGGRTLAHELAHSLLGPDHVPCTPESPNILANACWRPGREITLTAEQVRKARRQARTGRPVAPTARRTSHATTVSASPPFPSASSRGATTVAGSLSHDVNAGSA